MSPPFLPSIAKKAFVVDPEMISVNENLLKKLAKPLIVVATLIWGSTFFIMKDTLDTVNLQFLLAFRFTIAAVVLAIVFWKQWNEDIFCLLEQQQKILILV